MMSEHVRRFRGLLAEATAAIGREYFLLPVANVEGREPIEQYRERVYAYELYHQLRSRWPGEWPYSLGGEVDKRGHPVIRGAHLDNAKPDLLVHVPGGMEQNLVALEIKPLRPDGYPGEQEDLVRDIQKLIAFRNIGYEAAFMIVFGNSVNRVLAYAQQLRKAGARLDLVELYHHRQPGEPASDVKW
jgi:hypothetical protein